MEYEIEEDALLFDESTNPSLKHGHRQPVRHQSPVRLRDPAERRRPQKAEVIPDEEEQAA
jgi:hypothetical protein